ncbi:hypothetical protein EG832_12910, partial [bacterium]|nr:hypothetical protein [bacterium]
DRSYARKFVISEDELETVLKPLVVEPCNGFPHANILSVWVDILTSAGLNRAILSDDDIPKRLMLIEDSTSKANIKSRIKHRRANVKDEPFIDSMELRTFRNYPVQRTFTFRKVNLIYGANGSGKTSLLEAIELLYCGRNKRNPEVRLPYEFDVAFADGTSVIATSSRGSELFRDRNLVWYGQSEVKTNNLYRSFAQFNFLDTDAAVSIADSTSSIEEDLSKLLVGPEASKTWRDIERVNDALIMKLKDIRKLEDQVKEEISNLDKRIQEASSIKQESDSIHSRLKEMLSRVGWSAEQENKETFAGMLVESLSELMKVAEQSVVLDWTESPASIESMNKYCSMAENIIEKAEQYIGPLDAMQNNQKQLKERITRDEKGKDLADQAKRLIDAGVLIRVRECDKHRNTVATLSHWFDGLDVDDLMVLSKEDRGMRVITCHEIAVSKHFASVGLLIKIKKEYRDFSKLRDESLNLAQALRQIATRILQD